MAGDSPQTEAEWEEYINILQARSGRLRDVLTTSVTKSVDPSEQLRIIHAEMGWTKEDDTGGRTRSSAEKREAATNQAPAPELLDSIPAYAGARALEKNVRDPLLRGFLSTLPAGASEDDWLMMKGELDAAFRPFNDTSSELKRGHDLGYSRQTIRGNIVYCRRAVRAAEECEGIVATLSENGVLDAPKAAELSGQICVLREVIRHRIADLRMRAESMGA